MIVLIKIKLEYNYKTNTKETFTMSLIPEPVKDQFMQNIIPGRTILYDTYGYDSTYVHFYLVISKTPRMVKVIQIGQKITDALSQTSYYVVADPSNRNKTVYNFRLSPKSFYQNYQDIHFTNKKLHVDDARMYDGQPVRVDEY